MTTETARNGIAACGVGETAEKLTALLTPAGLNATAYGLIKLVPEEFWDGLDDIESFDWVLFTSPSAAKFALEAAPSSLNAKVAVLGEATAKAVTEGGGTVDIIAVEQSASGLVQAIEDAGLAPSRMLYPCSALASGELRLGLELAGHDVTQVVAYSNVGEESVMRQFSSDIEAGRLKAAAFTSASAVAYGNYAMGLRDLRIYCIGSSTAAEVENKGLRVYAVAKPQSLEALAELIIKSESNRE